MTDTPTIGSRTAAIPRILLWSGIVACGALFMLLLVTRAEQIQGQIKDVPPAILIVVALLLGVVLQNTRFSRRLLAVVSRPRSLVLIAVAAFVVLAAGSYFVFGTTPLSSDEQTQLFQARLFAQFKVMAHYPPELLDRVVPAGYQNYFILVSQDGRAISFYWPGWALLMTPFVWIGAPWLLGPAMASLGLFVMGRLAGLLAGAEAAALAILLTVTSGAFLVTGMSLFPAGGYLTLNLLFAWLLLRGGSRDAVLAGFVGGLALNLNNPVPHALFALPWLVWLVADRSRRRRLAWLCVGYAPGLALFCGWFALTSTLGASYGSGTGNFWHDRLPALVNLPTLEVLGLRFWEFIRLWIWSAPGLVVLAAIGWRSQAKWSGAWILGLAFGASVALYVFFPAGQGLGYGARYYQAAWGALPILAAILLIRPDAEALRRTVLIAAFAGLVLVVPFQIQFARGLAQVGYPPLQALESPGVNLYFVNTAEYGSPPVTINDSSLNGTLVLVSLGPVADQELVDHLYPGARLVISNAFGSGYARP